ncbi:MAG: hypothetical protein RL839_06235 [Gammaproteobacteria bacterium]
MWARIADNLKSRPIWLNLLLLFCAFMTFVYMPFDMFLKPVAEDQEVWFGLMLTGWAAKATEPLHWLIYGFGCYGIWQHKKWLHPWAALYTLQVALGMVVWSIVYSDGSASSALIALPFLLLAWLLWRSKPLFSN